MDNAALGFKFQWQSTSSFIRWVWCLTAFWESFYLARSKLLDPVLSLSMAVRLAPFRWTAGSKLNGYPKRDLLSRVSGHAFGHGLVT